MGVYSTVDCSEEHKTVNEGFDLETGANASVVLRCAWIDRYALVDDLLSNSRIYPGMAGFTVAPRAQTCAITGDDATTLSVAQSLEYGDALVTVNYGTKIVDKIAESLEPTVEFLKQDHKRFRWGSATGDPLTEGEAPGRQMRGLSLVRTLYDLAAMPAAVLTAYGGVNSAAYTSALLGFTFAIETLLYQPPQLNHIIRTAGTAGWNLTLKFHYNPNGWNKYWRAKSQAWEKIYLVDPAGEYKNYPATSFASLLY